MCTLIWIFILFLILTNPLYGKEPHEHSAKHHLKSVSNENMDIESHIFSYDNIAEISLPVQRVVDSELGFDDTMSPYSHSEDICFSGDVVWCDDATYILKKTRFLCIQNRGKSKSTKCLMPNLTKKTKHMPIFPSKVITVVTCKIIQRTVWSIKSPATVIHKLSSLSPHKSLIMFFICNFGKWYQTK